MLCVYSWESPDSVESLTVRVQESEVHLIERTNSVSVDEVPKFFKFLIEARKSEVKERGNTCCKKKTRLSPCSCC